MKWIWVIVLAIIGILAAIVAAEYLAVAIHALPSWIPGRHPGRGHYHKRGVVAAIISFIAFVAAGYLAYRAVQTDRMGTRHGSTVGSSDQLLSTPASESADRD